MALRAIDVRTRSAPRADTLRVPATPPTSLATVHPLHHAPRVATLAAQRRERRRWIVLGVVVFASPFAACLGVLGVVR